jgi:Ca-activated chloride channel family protein
VGTAKGGNIPIRWEDGSFKGYKTVKNEMVTTKLDEGYIKSIGKNVKNFRYWIANSYSLPTEEIMDFFRATYNQKHNNGDLRVRPVFSHYILIPAILLYCLAVLFGRFPSLRTIQSIILLCFFTGGLSAEEPKELPAEIKQDLKHIKEGKATRTEVLKTAEKLLKAKEDQKAAELYSEYVGKKDEEAIRFNHATSLLKLGKTKEAMPIIQDLMNNSQNEDLKNKMRSNLANAIKQQKENKENKKDNKEKKDDKQDKNEQDKKDKKDSEKQDDKKNQKPGQNKDENKEKSGSGKSDKQDNKSGGKEEEKKEDKKKEDKKENKKEDKNDGEGDQKKEEEKPQSLEQKEKEIEQRRKMTKTPGMIKQIMNDDRELQKKLMDTTTKEKGELKPKRDW